VYPAKDFKITEVVDGLVWQGEIDREGLVLAKEESEKSENNEAVEGIEVE